MHIKNTCCKEEKNIKLLESSISIKVFQCVVCNRKHYELTAEPLIINTKLL